MQTLSSTDLLGQLNHLKVPRPETVVGVDGPGGKIHVGDEGFLKVKAGLLPAQLKVLVHQLCQGGPVPVLQGDPEGRTASVSLLLVALGSIQTNLARSVSSANILIASTTRGSPVKIQV